ncbi:MAG: hypothetical protein O2904_03865 [bacterium]|nr:hypothetical protein [bacterium]
MTHTIRYFDHGQREVQKSPERYIYDGVPKGIEQHARTFLIECLQELHDASALAGQGQEKVEGWIRYVQSDYLNWDVVMHRQIQEAIGDEAKEIENAFRLQPSDRELQRALDEGQRDLQDLMYEPIAKGHRMSKPMHGRRVA